MKEEKDLIPYTPSGIPQTESWLVIAPHPDDETIGMGGAILKAVRAGIKVFIVFVTSGEMQGSPEEREEEAASALKVLGVPKGQIEFWRFPDRGVARRTEALRFRLEKFILERRPGVVFATSPMEYHPDHRAVSKVSYDVALCLGVNLLFYEVLRQAEANMLIPLTEEEMKVKEEALKQYKSQLFAGYLSRMKALNHLRTITIPGYQYAEAFYDCRNGPHPCFRWYWDDIRYR